MTTAIEPVTRTCRDCRRTFEVTVAEIRALEDIAPRAGWTEIRPPSRCLSCRRLSREAPHIVFDNGQDEWLTCVDCGQVFLFGGRDREFFARQVPPWSTPKRCRPCRRARAARR